MTKFIKTLMAAALGAVICTAASAHDVKTKKMTKAEISEFYGKLRAETKLEKDMASKDSFTFARASGELKLMEKLSRGDWDRDFCLFLCTAQMEKDINECAKNSSKNGGDGGGSTIPQVGTSGLPGLDDDFLEDTACIMAAAMRAGECNAGC